MFADECVELTDEIEQYFKHIGEDNYIGTVAEITDVSYDRRGGVTIFVNSVGEKFAIVEDFVEDTISFEPYFVD